MAYTSLQYSDNFVFPGGGQSTYLPILHGDLLVAYVRNPAKFPINNYINVRKVDHMRGGYVNFQNSDQARVNNSPQHYFWADGADAPRIQDGNDAYDFKYWNARRFAYTKQLGFLGEEQAAWDLKDQAAIFLAMKGMTNRSYRIHQTLTTTANYPSGQQFTASVTGGATWANATSQTPSIRKCVMLAAIAIQKATLASVQFNDLYLIMNPDTAEVVATSQEWIDYVKQQPQSLAIWEGQEQYVKYNIPNKFFGINAIVDDTVYNSALPGATVTNVDSFSFPDNVAILVTKQQAVESMIGAAFSTFELFAFQDFETFIFSDAVNRRYDLQVVENVDDTFLFAPQSGAIIATNS